MCFSSKVTPYIYHRSAHWCWLGLGIGNPYLVGIYLVIIENLHLGYRRRRCGWRIGRIDNVL